MNWRWILKSHNKSKRNILSKASCYILTLTGRRFGPTLVRDQCSQDFPGREIESRFEQTPPMFSGVITRRESGMSSLLARFLRALRKSTFPHGCSAKHRHYLYGRRSALNIIPSVAVLVWACPVNAISFFQMRNSVLISRF